MLVALVGVVLLTAAGSAIDLGRAYLARQQLSNVATLTCQYANLGSVTALAFGAGTGSQNGAGAYQAAVGAYLTTALAAQNMPWPILDASAFSYVPNGPGNVTLNVNVPATILSVVGITEIPAGVTAHCFDQIAPLAVTPVPGANTAILVRESFENSACTGACYVFYSVAGQANQTRYTPQSTPGTNAGYVGASGNEWIITGYCLEVDTVGVIRNSVPDGTHSAELDCDNGRNSAGNSSISTKVYLQAGKFELRWNYASRVYYPNYDPVYICGSVAADASWANDTVSNLGTGARSNQINVYLDASTGASPPTHTTLDGSQQLAGANLVDSCVDSVNWVQRSIAITVTTPGYYWLSFAADGANESFGGQIDNILLCSGTCTGSVQDDFPQRWTAAANGGTNAQLLRETFEAPQRAASPCGGCGYVMADLDRSVGNTGSTASGWPSQTASGWTVTPYDLVQVDVTAAAQGSQSVALAAAADAAVATTNRSISRKLLLNPGYYEIDYDYVSNTLHTGIAATLCTAAPSAAAVRQLAVSGSGAATDRLTGAALTAPLSDNLVGVFMSNAQMVSAPTSTAQHPTATYANPGGGTTTVPTVPIDRINLAHYDATQPNPLLDLCRSAASWQPRTATVKIIKTGQYWLTFAGLGSGDGRAGAIDDVRVTALGSLSMTSPPSKPVTIPAPDPQPGSVLAFSGFSIIAEHTP